jgi:hypothetical protein
MGDTFAVMHSLEVRQPTTALIVGTGYIGLEMAKNSFRSWLGWNDLHDADADADADEQDRDEDGEHQHGDRPPQGR